MSDMTEPLRTREEWNEWCLHRGTSGDQVWDILTDWAKENKHLQARIKQLEAQLEKVTRILK